MQDTEVTIASCSIFSLVVDMVIRSIRLLNVRTSTIVKTSVSVLTNVGSAALLDSCNVDIST